MLKESTLNKIRMYRLYSELARDNKTSYNNNADQYTMKTRM